MTGGPVAVVTPVYRNERTLAALGDRVAGALRHREWRLRLVVDASPDDSLAVAQGLASGDARISVTALPVNVGQNRALVHGLAAEEGAEAWVCLDADLQDPPEAIPALLDRLAEGDAAAVFAGRRGRYESPLRLLTGRLHRALLAGLLEVPRDAGAFVAVGPQVRDALIRLDPPSIVAGIGVFGLPAASLPVERSARPSGGSAWTASGRAGQSARTLAWAGGQRLSALRQRWTTTSA